MVRQPLPRNAAIRDAILWALEGGHPAGVREITNTIGSKWTEEVRPQLKALCRLEQLEEIVEFDPYRVSYRRVAFEPALDQALAELEAAFGESL